MKEEHKQLYALTVREARAAQDACNRVTADLPANLGISDAQFDAADRAAGALSTPFADHQKIVLVLTAKEFLELKYLVTQALDDNHQSGCIVEPPMARLRKQVNKRIGEQLRKALAFRKK